MTSRTGRWILTALWIMPVACASKPPVSSNESAAGPAWFQEVTTERGLDFLHDPGPIGTYFMPQIMGSGGAFLDTRSAASVARGDTEGTR